MTREEARSNALVEQAVAWHLHLRAVSYAACDAFRDSAIWHQRESARAYERARVHVDEWLAAEAAE